MNLKKIFIPVLGIGGIILTAKLLNKTAKLEVANVVSKVETEPLKTFGGVLLSDLNELAKQIYHGIGCSIDQCGFLIFDYKSNRGHQINHAQMILDEVGNLINLGGHYPGQLLSGADKFAKLVNEKYKFKK